VDPNVIFPKLPTYVGVLSWGGALSVAVTVILPIVAALFMRSHWTAMAKGLVLLVVAAVKAFLEAWIAANDAHTHFNAGAAAYSTVVMFALGVISYFGLWRGTTVQQSALAGGVVPSAAVVDGVAVPTRTAPARRGSRPRGDT
jgi:drug/metabolite transporter (DMT)-like permease